jgi:hypothetical protein
VRKWPGGATSSGRDEDRGVAGEESRESFVTTPGGLVMADVHRGEAEAPPRPAHARSGYPTSAEDDFSGWAWFIGGLMGLVGIFQVIFGITALAHAAAYSAPTSDLVIETSYSTWGWVHLVLGILLLVVGGGLAFGQPWARVAGIGVAVLSALVNFTFLPAAPVATTLIIGIDVVLIWAIAVHGAEGRRAG